MAKNLAYSISCDHLDHLFKNNFKIPKIYIKKNYELIFLKSIKAQPNSSKKQKNCTTLIWFVISSIAIFKFDFSLSNII